MSEEVTREFARMVTDLVEAARPLFAGKPHPVVGAALADLTAIWLAGIVVQGDEGETDRLRGRLMLGQMQTVRRLTAVNAGMMGTGGGIE